MVWSHNVFATNFKNPSEFKIPPDNLAIEKKANEEKSLYALYLPRYTTSTQKAILTYIGDEIMLFRYEYDHIDCFYILCSTQGVSYQYQPY
jgi:hypothetical protein